MSGAPHPEKLDWPRSWTAAVIVASALLFLVPAFYNRFPLLFPDTDDYLKVSYGHFWTLDRSGFYGLLFKPVLIPTSGLVGLWLAVVLQVTIVAALLIIVARQAAPFATPLRILGVIALTCLVTSLPWHAAQLIPDAFTGALILTAWAAVSRNSGTSGTPLLWLATVLLALMHYTHLGLLVVAISVALVFAALSGAGTRELGRRVTLAAMAVAAVVGAHVTANGLFLHRWAVSPAGSWFLFARLNEDGLVPLWLDDHCGRDAPRELCEIRATLPRDSQVLLWSGTSPLNRHIHKKIDRPEFWHWIDMLGQASSGAIKEHPLMFLSAGTRNAAKQFVHFNTLDDLCPQTCAGPTIIKHRPDVAPWLNNSRQLRDTMPKAAIRAVTGAAETLALVLLVPMFVLAVRRRDRVSQSLIATVSACIVANAFLGAALSAVNDRYQSRVVWLSVFTLLLVAARWSGRPGAEPERRRW